MPYAKNKAGIIPLIVLIVAGIVFLSGGAYIVRKEFITKGKSGKAALDEKKIEKQIANPEILSSPSPKSKPATSNRTLYLQTPRRGKSK